MSRRIAIAKPDGDVVHLDPAAADGDLRLSRWLELNGMNLNTRCGGRGICRGCQVDLCIDGVVTSRRSCQMAVADLPEAACRIDIPRASWRDDSLHGISVFEVLCPMSETRQRAGLGLSLDIGTTTVAGALWDLSSGTCLATAALPNAQRRFGDNVLARIDHGIGVVDGSADLQRALVEQSLRPLVARLCGTAKTAADGIVAATAAGNTVMLHTLAGASLEGFGSYPFRPVFLRREPLSAGGIGLDGDYPVALSPCPGPFVGGDIAVGALAAGMLEQTGPCMLIDFGTNGEILLKHPGGYLATATAAGPAFEGGRLECGAAAGPGVVSSLALADGSWQPRLSGGGVGPATGISGAAYIDFLALGLHHGLLNGMGRLLPGAGAGAGGVTTRERAGAITVAGKQFITEEDVAELLQAKAAIGAGVLTLLDVAGLGVGDLQTLFIAGGFGYHLHLGNAAAVGLIPGLAQERMRVIGNASLAGASVLLLGDNNQALEPLIGNCKVIELNQIGSFEDHFIDAMALGPMPG